ncbi:RNB domain-containing ribonuclease [Janibacter sp. G56]|uniref:RNB domain-containing ribonuclease n=1 Tax=Janibacter sp. G56 TaxID=3418717 RepID=UPI003D05145C
MPQRTVHLRSTDPQAKALAADSGLEARFDAIRAELHVPADFPPEVLAEAEKVAAQPLDVPERDETAVPFLTIDPPGSMDLDQAMHIERQGAGYRVRYAIAYLPAFVAPGGAIDEEARRRGQTLYAPDERSPLHPPVFSEGAASLLPDQVTAAYVWDMTLAADGEGTAAEVYRALVRSVNRFDYEQVQELIDSGTDDERLMLLKEVGEKRLQIEADRGGASLPMPEQEVDEVEEGVYRLHYRPLLPVESWNAQMSLMTGMAAAEMMLHAQIGILRTMPAPESNVVQTFRRQARALGVEWPAEMLHGEFLRTLDQRDPKHLALIHEATSLFRGAGYTPFDGDVPELVEHAGMGYAYAHVTAPLRRLVDRFGLALAEALSSGQDVPPWVRQALPTLPELMKESDSRARSLERACTDAVEAATLQDRVGAELVAHVVDITEDKDVVVQVLDPAVVAKVAGPAELGAEVRVRVVTADIATGKVELALV